MKSLGLAFVIVAAAGSAVYFLVSFVFHAQEYAGGLAAMIFGALPILHQDFEKQATKSAVSGIVPQPGPGQTNPFETPENAQAAHSTALSTGNPSTAAAVPTPTPETYAVNPVPVYVSNVPAQSAIVARAETQLPTTPITAPPTTFNAVSRTGSANLVVILVYSIAVVIAVRGVSDFTRLLYRWYEGLPGDGLEAVFVFIGSWLPVLIVGVGVFLVGLWVGRKSPRLGWLITIGAVVLGLLLARLINMLVGYDESNAFLNDYLLPRDQASVDWRFANPDDYDRLYLSLSWVFTFGLMVLESVVALAGYWIGKRLKSARAGR